MGDYILEKCTQMSQHLARQGSTQSKKASYLLALFARFFFGFGVNGAGGVFSIRRSTFSALGGAASRLFASMIMVGV